MTEKPRKIRADHLEQSIQAEAPHIYFNGFSATLGAGDVILVLLRQGRQVGVLNMSYTMAKTLAEKMNTLVDILESKTGQQIMTSDFVAQKLEEEDEDDTP